MLMDLIEALKASIEDKKRREAYALKTEGEGLTSTVEYEAAFAHARAEDAAEARREARRQQAQRPSADFLEGYEKARADLLAYGCLKRSEDVSR